MPTYEYRCANGHDFEEFYLRMSAAKSELPCPTCGLLGERRMSAGGGLLFKGSGFYITDYGKDGKKAAPTSKGGASDGAKSDGAKSDGNRSDGAKADASKSDAGNPASAKSDKKPSAAPAAPPAKGGE
jgi:putative FmdB family regulatory protein